LVQEKQADLLNACGFTCAPEGEMIFDGHKIMMYAPTREKGPAVADIIGFGGAAFGGKTYGLLCLVRVAAELWPGIQIAFFRRSRVHNFHTSF